jgi:hypothetical protein
MLSGTQRAVAIVGNHDMLTGARNQFGLISEVQRGSIISD